MKRQKISRKVSKKIFRKTANKPKAINVRGSSSRGGIRL